VGVGKRILADLCGVWALEWAWQYGSTNLRCVFVTDSNGYTKMVRVSSAAAMDKRERGDARPLAGRSGPETATQEHAIAYIHGRAENKREKTK